MNFDRRTFAGAVPAAAIFGGLALSQLFFCAYALPAAAQETAVLTPEQHSVATALEGAFMSISDIVGPATVRIAAISAPPALAKRSGADGGDSSGDETDPSFPFSQFFGSPGAAGRGIMPPSPQRQPRTTSGSGVIIRKDGWILTNDHVVEDAGGGKVKVILSDNSEFTGKVYRDPTADLAVIKIDAGRPLPYVRMADSAKLRIGQWAIAIGSPFAQQNTMTTGIVSALHRSREIPDDSRPIPRYYSDMIQTDAAINPGNSGGPLLNINGELIGINAAILSPSGSSSGVGFAIPSNTAKLVAEQLITRGKVTRSSLGVIPADIPPVLRTRLGTARGAYVDQVAADTPAEKAGIEPGDVITKFGTTDVADEIGLRDAITFSPPGTTVPITLLRDGHTVNLNATLVKRDDPTIADEHPEAAPVHKAASELGIEASNLTPDIQKAIGVSPETKGVAVKTVQQGSPAYDADLSSRMIITAVNGKPVATVDALDAAMSAVKSGDIVTLSILIPQSQGRPSKGVAIVLVP